MDFQKEEKLLKILLQNGGGQKAILHAVWNENFDQLCTLIEANCDINQPFEVFKNHVINPNFFKDIRNYLTNQGKAETYSVQNYPIVFSILDLAVSKNDITFVKKLISLNAEINHESTKMSYSSSIAFALHKPNMVEFLLQKGAKVCKKCIDLSIKLKLTTPLKLFEK